MRHLFKNLSILGNKHFKFYISLLVLVVFFCAVYYLAHFDQIFQYGGDEGLYFMRAFLHLNGFVLYRDIFIDQPPVLVKLLYFAFKLFEPSVVVARSLVLILISLMLGSLFYIIIKSQNIFSAMMTMALICTIPKFIQLSVSTMNGLPAIAFAVIACLGIYGYEVHRKYVYLILSAFFLALGLQTKLFVFVFIPAISFELLNIEYKHLSNRIRLHHFFPMFIWVASLLVIYLAIAWAIAVDYDQIIKPFLLAKEHYTEKPFAKVFEWISDNKGIFLLSLGSLMCFRPRSTKLFFIPLIVTVSSFFLFSHHAPIWHHHRMLMMIPAAWLASFAAYEFFSLKNWEEARKGKTKKKYWMIFKLVYIGFSIIVVIVHLRMDAYLAVHSLDETALHEVQEAIDLIDQNKNEGTVLVTDKPSFAFHAQVLIPPSLSTISEKQIKTGLITEESIARIINENEVEMVLWSRFPELGEKVMQRVGSPYDLVYQADGHDLKLYFKKKSEEHSQLFKGFGKNTIGGQGGKIYTVKNLNPSGPGSLLEGIQKEGPRVIRFSVSGTINLLRPLIVKNPFVTIDGSSAPNSGITLSGAGIIIKTKEVIVKHLKIRVGDRLDGPDPEDRDSIAIRVPQGSVETIENIVVDHCSLSWATDENISTWIDGKAELKNITISHNIISEGLKFSIHPEGRHSMGLLIGDNTQNVTIIGNVFAHNHGRNPQLKGGVNAEVVSNVMYNPGEASIGLSGSNNGGPIQAQIANNYFVPGKDTKDSEKHIAINSNASNNSELYIENNHGPGTSWKDRWRIIHFKSKLEREEISKIQSQIPLWSMSYPELSFENILDHAGAFPDRRDEVDQRIILDVRNLTGEHINTPYKQ